MSGFARPDSHTGSSGRRVAALWIFWLSQLVLTTLAGLVAASASIAVSEGIPELVRRASDMGGYFQYLVVNGEGRLLLCAYALVATATTLLVAPVIGPLRLTVTGRSLRTSVIGASILGGLVTFALVGLVAELPLLYGAGVNLGAWTVHPVGLFTSWIVAGAVWAAILWKAGASRDPMGLDRLLRRLFALTMLETVLAVPIFLLARKKESCYCSLHSFFGILGGSVVLFMLCGPWALLFLTRTARRGWQRSACPTCGYPRRTGAVVCSECGGALPPRVDANVSQGEAARS